LDARVIMTEANHAPLEALRKMTYRGTVQELTLALPTTFLANGKAEAILDCFKGYDRTRWRRRDIDNRFVIFSQ
jgi:hypothetical protein